MYRIKSLKKKDPIADKPFDKIQYLLTICQETLRKPEIRGHFFNLTKGSQHGLFRPAAETNAHGAPRDTRRQHRPRKASRREPARQSPERHAPRQEGRETFPTHKRLHGLTSPRVAGTWRNRGSAARPAGARNVASCRRNGLAATSALVPRQETRAAPGQSGGAACE